MNVWTWFGKLAHAAMGLVLPPACAVCESPLPVGEPLGLCVGCFGRLPRWDKSGVLPPQLPKVIDAFAAPCLYEGVMRDAILRMKFQDGTHLAPVLAKLLVPLVPEGAAMLVPVPMHRKALRGRLYNQAALVAQALALKVGIPADVTALVRVKPSDGQAKRTRAQRLKLASSDFAASAKVAGKHVVLVDDIYTTGATAKACALALKKAGAVRVDVLTLAYTAAE